MNRMDRMPKWKVKNWQKALVQELNRAELRVECDNANPSLSPANQTVAKGFYPVNPVNPVQCFHGSPGREFRQDEQNGQDTEMEDLPKIGFVPCRASCPLLIIKKWR